MLERSLTEIAKLLRTKAITVGALIEEAIANKRDALGAYREFDEHRLRELARAADAALAAGRDFGPLHGIPLSVKDIYGVPGYATYAGTTMSLPDKWVRAGPVVQRCLDGFAIVTGKTHTVELAFAGIGINNHWGTPRNPWDTERHRIPGGSSSGAGVSLAEGSALVALGTDTAGSVRVPASMTGNVGVKTTKGRWSTDGIVPLSSTLDTPGILTRTVEDAIVAFEWIDRTKVLDAPPLAGLRLGVLGEPFFDECDPGIAEAIESAIGGLGACGARITDVALPEAVRARELFQQGGVAAAELYAFLARELPELIDKLDPVVRDRVQGVAEQPAHEYVARLEALTRLTASADEVFDEFDVLLSPTTTGTPAEVSALDEIAAYRRANMLALRNTAMISSLGLCAISMPVGKDAAGMPVGLQVVGRAGADARLLAIARRFEHALGDAAVRLGSVPRTTDTKNG